MSQAWDSKKFQKPDHEALQKKLSKLEYEVTQKSGTEKPFKNEYWNHHQEGIYVDKISGEPLFLSSDKFDSGTGWPSFTRPLDQSNITYRSDKSLFHERTEVRSRWADSHLGHVFDDGPAPTGKRYCINSAALTFIPTEELESKGYGEYSSHFKDKSVAKSILAGGCFWCMVSPFKKLEGVLSVVSGYTGGTVDRPTYEQVSSGKSGHIESIEITYNPKLISYEKLLDVFWKNIDPLDNQGQFCDKGEQYQSAIFFKDNEQKKVAEKSIQKIEAQLKQKIATRLAPAKTFFPAEEYHQDYYQKNPIRYKYYRTTCGRDKRLKELWGKD